MNLSLAFHRYMTAIIALLMVVVIMIYSSNAGALVPGCLVWVLLSYISFKLIIKTLSKNEKSNILKGK